MKKTFFFVCILITAVAFNSFAQTAVAVLGDIPANTFTAGVTTPVYTTSDRITKSVRLNTIAPDYAITSYKCSIVAGTTTWGPVNVTGALLTDEIITHVRDTHGPNVKVVFDNIHALHSSADVTIPEISVKYDQ